MYDAFARVVRIVLGGNTNFMNVPDVIAEIKQYADHIYFGAECPDSIKFAERR
jgi:hypothetical protein